MPYINDEDELSNEFQQYREWRKAMLLYNLDYETNGNPNLIGDHHGKHKEWTSDAVVNLFDTAYRWGLESIKTDIRSLVSRYTDKVFEDKDRELLIKKINDLIEKKIQNTFFMGNDVYTATDTSLTQERKEAFIKLRKQANINNL